MDGANEQITHVKQARKNLTSAERKAVFLYLTQRCGNGEILPAGGFETSSNELFLQHEANFKNLENWETAQSQ